MRQSFFFLVLSWAAKSLVFYLSSSKICCFGSILERVKGSHAYMVMGDGNLNLSQPKPCSPPELLNKTCDHIFLIRKTRRPSCYTFSANVFMFVVSDECVCGEELLREASRLSPPGKLQTAVAGGKPFH